MLSRTAADLYWMARYFERAESTLRTLSSVLDATLTNKEIKNLYSLPLEIQNCFDDYVQHNGKSFTAKKVSNYLLMSDSTSSVKSCLFQARENARAVRTKLSSDVWEAINQTWLELSSYKNKPIQQIADWLGQRALLFHGAVHISMPTGLSKNFIQLGASLERADQTLRVLQIRVLLQDLSQNNQYYLWNILLNSISSFEAYKDTFVDPPTSEGVLKFLIFNKNIPRSVRYCLESSYSMLDNIKAQKRRESLRSCVEPLVKLRFDEYRDIVNTGEKTYIEELQNDINLIGAAIHNSYFVAI